MLISNHRSIGLYCYDGWRKNFNQPVKKNLRTYNSIRKNTTGQ